MTVPEELAELPYADLLRPHEGPLEPEGDYDTVHLHQREFGPRSAAEGARFLEAAVTDCVFDGTGMRRARMNDLWVSGTRFTGVSLVESEWLDSSLTGCSLAGVEAFGAVLRRVRFRRCKLDSVNLRAAVLREVVFEDCVLRDVDLAEARLEQVAFPGTRIERARLGRTALTTVDLRGATAIDLADGYESLRGAVIDTGQLLDLAPALARALGIVVAED
ncbi:pentapeptide repeat-containing protein [Actinacidiphila yeochonensis]|uniref:pentapeptide repeat-containing protein n=1 Tax=Actinacidiphila yeochonensis TaxID=89050 RepID=UPI000563B696|nr:pentapeptide repeat-containing protein [Actinacidiphila yeochonensis]